MVKRKTCFADRLKKVFSLGDQNRGRGKDRKKKGEAIITLGRKTNGKLFYTVGKVGRFQNEAKEPPQKRNCYEGKKSGNRLKKLKKGKD